MNVLRRLPLNYIKYIFFFPLPTSNDFPSLHFRILRLASDCLLFLPFLDIPLCPLFLCICTIIIFIYSTIVFGISYFILSRFTLQLFPSAFFHRNFNYINFFTFACFTFFKIILLFRVYYTIRRWVENLLTSEIARRKI